MQTSIIGAGKMATLVALDIQFFAGETEIRSVNDLLNTYIVQSYVQQRTWEHKTGEALFPAKKIPAWSIKYIKGANNAPVAASVHAYDTEAQVGSREGFEEIEMELALIKRKIQIPEELIIKLADAQRTSPEEFSELVAEVFNDIDHMVESVLTKAEVMRYEAATTGKIELNENGFKGTIDYMVPARNRVALKPEEMFDNPDSNPIKVLTRLKRVVPNTMIAGVITSDRILALILGNKHVREAIWGVAASRMVTEVELNEFLKQHRLPVIATEERTYRVQKNDGSYELRRLVAEDAFALIPEGQLGETIYGRTAEETQMYLGNTASRVRSYGEVIAQVFTTNDPPAYWTKAVARVLPSFPRANEVVLATNTIKTDDIETP